MKDYKYTVIIIYTSDNGCHEDIKSFGSPELAFEFKKTLTTPYDGYYEVLIEER